MEITVGVLKVSWFDASSYRVIFTARKRSLRRLCFHRCLFVHGGGSWYVSGVSIQGGLCPGGISVKGGSLSGGRGLCLGGGVSVQGNLSRGICPGESLPRGGLSGRSPPEQRLPRTVMSGRYASHWNAFLFCDVCTFRDRNKNRHIVVCCPATC